MHLMTMQDGTDLVQQRYWTFTCVTLLVEEQHTTAASLYIPYSTYYKPMIYYKPTTLFSSKFMYGIRRLYMVYSNLSTYYKPTPCSELM